MHKLKHNNKHCMEMKRIHVCFLVTRNVITDNQSSIPYKNFKVAVAFMYINVIGSPQGSQWFEYIVDILARCQSKQW